MSRQGVVVKISDYCESLDGYFVEVEFGYRDREIAFCCALVNKLDRVIVINGMALCSHASHHYPADLSDLSDGHRNILADIYHDQEIDHSRKKVDEIIRLSAMRGIEL